MWGTGLAASSGIAAVVGDGCETGDSIGLEQWNGSQGFASADDSGAHTQGAGAVVRHLLLARAGQQQPRRRHWSGSTHHPGRWASAFGEGGPAALISSRPAVPPRPRPDTAGGVESRGATGRRQPGPGTGWYWRVVRRFVWERFALNLSRSSCLNYLHRLGFSYKRPKKHLLKANDSLRMPPLGRRPS